MGRILLIISCVCLCATAGAAKLECQDPDTEEKFTVKPNRAKKAAKKVQKKLLRKQVHVLDLSEDLKERRLKLGRAIASNDLCTLSLHSRYLSDGLDSIFIDEDFVSEKFSRVERWLRFGEWEGAKKKKSADGVSKASALMAKGKFKPANKALNRALVAMFDDPTMWNVPDSLPEPAEGQAQTTTEVDAAEVAEGCPSIAKSSGVTEGQLAKATKRLKRLMNDGSIRVNDVKNAMPLARDLASYRSINAQWPAMRVTCALIAKVKGTKVDLGLVMGRFHRANQLKREKGKAVADSPEFKSLVRAASGAIAEKDFAAAHQKLETLLIFLGDVSNPADTLRALETH